MTSMPSASWYAHDLNHTTKNTVWFCYKQSRNAEQLIFMHPMKPKIEISYPSDEIILLPVWPIADFDL